MSYHQLQYNFAADEIDSFSQINQRDSVLQKRVEKTKEARIRSLKCPAAFFCLHFDPA